MKRTLLSLAIAAVLAGCAAPPAYLPKDAPVSVNAPQAKLGDYWEYAMRDGYTGLPWGLYRYEVTQVDADRIIVTLTNDGRPVDRLVYAAGWNGRELPVTPLQRFRYEPSNQAFSYPLEPGKAWKAVLNSTDVATGKHYRTYVYGKVVGWEHVRVPAGEFDALKVERKVFAGTMEGYRTQEEIIETDWYVPSVRRAVLTRRSSQHFDTSRGGGDGGGEYPLRIRGDYLIGELVAYSP
jgi:(2Fe-2S) ferredoxin